jgi:putative flippase GtrA
MKLLWRILQWARATKLGRSKFGRLFLDKKFAHYTWIGVFISTTNVVVLWLLIDVMGVPTIISSILVVGITFIVRYVLFDKFKVL